MASAKIVSLPSETEGQLFRGHIPELAGLRGIAVALVFMNHYAPAGRFFQALGNIGWLGVDIFFVLSGFLITGILLDTRENRHYYRDFYVRRSLRIFPAYYLVLFSILLVSAWQEGDDSYKELKAWGHPAWFVLYAANIKMAVAGLTPKLFALVPFWSLHVEEQFYLIWPFLVRRLRKETLAKALIFMVAFSPLLRIALWRWDPGNALLQYVLLPCRLDGLALGSMIALRFRQGPWEISIKWLSVITALAISVAFITYSLGGHEWNSPFVRTLGYLLFAFAFACTLLWVIRMRGSWHTKWLRVGVLAGLGTISYGIYLLQVPANEILQPVFALHLPIPGWRIGTLVAFTVLLAVISWFGFEKPILALKQRFSSQALRIAEKYSSNPLT